MCFKCYLSLPSAVFCIVICFCLISTSLFYTIGLVTFKQYRIKYKSIYIVLYHFFVEIVLYVKAKYDGTVWHDAGFQFHARCYEPAGRRQILKCEIVCYMLEIKQIHIQETRRPWRKLRSQEAYCSNTMILPRDKTGSCKNTTVLSYCCDSRSYCMQYFNAIHCDRNISTSEYKKSVCCQSADPTITADLRRNPQSAVSLLTNEPGLFDRRVSLSP